MGMTEKDLSPSRTYVAMCNTINFRGFYFKKFTIPPETELQEQGLPADISPSWYFLNRLNFFACLEEIITAEDFANLQDQKPLWPSQENAG